MLYYEYEVECVNEDSEYCTFQGVTSAENLQEAIKNVISFYEIEDPKFAPTNIISIKITTWDISGCLEMSRDTLSRIAAEVL